MIEIRNVTKTFNSGTVNEHKAIDNLSLTLNDGDFITVIGSNGAGKSTLLNIISGSISSDVGLILLNGTDVSNLSEHKRAPYFGRVFQDPMKGTATDMTVIENLALAKGRGRSRSLFRWSIRRKDKAYYEEQLKSLGLGLESRIHQKVGVLSGGQRQAITLLMATMAQKPSYNRIRKDYIKFNPSRRDEAKKEVTTALKQYFREYLDGRKEIKKQVSLEVKTLKAKRKDLKKDFKKSFKILKKDDSIEKELLKSEKNKYRLSKKEINASIGACKKSKKPKFKELYKTFDSKVREFDVTKPVLLLDEHTAALDPKTAAKVLEITDRIVKEQHLTTIMITHNMNDAIKYGNRLIMMSKGKIAVDISGEEKKKLTIPQLLDMFSNASGNDVLADSAIL